MTPIDTLFLIIIFLFSVVIHEVSHGAVANALGDPTARLSGRLTLNPIKHIDPLGSIIVPAFFFLLGAMSGGGIIFGWAKPVPVNTYNLRDQRWGIAKVSIAGPGINLLIALFFGLLLRFAPSSPGVFMEGMYLLFSKIVWINIILGVFNLIPIPPFDGSKILFSFLPRSAFGLVEFFERWGMILIILLIFFGFDFIVLISYYIFNLIVGSPIAF